MEHLCLLPSYPYSSLQCCLASAPATHTLQTGQGGRGAACITTHIQCLAGQALPGRKHSSCRQSSFHQREHCFKDFPAHPLHLNTSGKLAIFQTANHWCNLVETGQTEHKQRSFPGETKLKLNKIKPDENNDV